MNWIAFPPKPEGANPEAPKLIPLPFNERVALSDSNELFTLPLENAPLNRLPVSNEVVELSHPLINPPGLGVLLSPPLDKPPSPS